MSGGSGFGTNVVSPSRFSSNRPAGSVKSDSRNPLPPLARGGDALPFWPVIVCGRTTPRPRAAHFCYYGMWRFSITGNPSIVPRYNNTHHYYSKPRLTIIINRLIGATTSWARADPCNTGHTRRIFPKLEFAINAGLGRRLCGSRIAVGISSSPPVRMLAVP